MALNLESGICVFKLLVNLYFGHPTLKSFKIVTELFESLYFSHWASKFIFKRVQLASCEQQLDNWYSWLGPIDE